MKKKIGVLVSGGGTNLQALLDAQGSGILKSGEVSVVVSSKPCVFALERAKRAGVPAETVDRKAYGTKVEFEAALCAVLESYQVDYLVLAGFMLVLSEDFIKTYSGRMINVHPSLIPAFCGDGFYGLHVHERALEYGVKVTGATVHFVNEVTDGGAIILQKPVAILETDTPETLQKRVMQEAEHIILPRAAELLCAGKIRLEGRRVYIEE